MWKQVTTLDSIGTCFILFYFFVNLLFWACECHDLSLPGPADLGVRALCSGAESFNLSDYSEAVCLPGPVCAC